MAGLDPFYVVGIGASAGGLQAATQLLSCVPAKTPLALVLVQHLDPVHHSELAELLSRSSKLPVTWITDPTPVQPGHVYVLPPGQEAVIEKRVLNLRPRRIEPVVSTVDYFFQSLAHDCVGWCAAVILSGTGSDGAIGLKKVKAAGGFTFVQEESTASFPGMSRSAIDSGDADHILPPAGIANELVKLTQQPVALGSQSELEGEAPALLHDTENWMAIFRVLSVRKGVDFSEYKQSTIMRRLARRMSLKKIESLQDYLKLLLRDRDEVDMLYESLLINVTRFFRDPECFDFLKEQILPSLIAQHGPDNSAIRIWVPGCSTGEEAYSLGILLREVLEAAGHLIPVQIFGTDLSERAIDHARSGLYSAVEVADIGPERLRRFFFNTSRGYVVQKALRDMCIFARQNVTKDSPFSRLDLISCRNLLIYLGARLQKKLMPIFHYALGPGGNLMLGTSESVGAQVDLFRLVDRRFRIYSRKSSVGRRAPFDFAVEQVPSNLRWSNPL